jgi:hypothetical protein
MVWVTGAFAPGAVLEMRLSAQADGDGSDLKPAWDHRRTVDADGSYVLTLAKPAVGSLDRCVGGWTARFAVRTPAGVVVQDRTEWVPLWAGHPR